MDQTGDHMKMIFDYFQIQKWGKKWVHVSSFHVSCLSYDPYIVKKMYFFQFCADHSKKSKSVKAIYIYAPESSHSLLT